MGKKRREPDPLEAYRRVRKPLPPPGRPIRDRRRKMEEVASREEIEGREIGMFDDRADAGRRLADALTRLEGATAVVLAIPRGGVEVGLEIARAHGWPLDVVIPRKVRAPRNPELGLGAVAPGVTVLDERLVETLGVSREYLDREIAEQESEIERRAAAYRAGRAPADLEGRIAVVVDDGMATGGTAIAAVRWARAQGAKRTVLAVPVAPVESVHLLEKEADEVICLLVPERFYAVGQWYRRFPQVPDGEVVRLLEIAP